MARDLSALDPTSLLAHGDFVTALARGLVADPNRADDVVQDTWLAALSNPPRDASRLRAWLAAVTRNFARQSSRRDERSRSRETLAARAEGIPSTAELCEREATRREVVEALLELSEPQRSALLLRFYEGLPPREIARRLGVPVETARTESRLPTQPWRRTRTRRPRSDREPRLPGTSCASTHRRRIRSRLRSTRRRSGLRSLLAASRSPKRSSALPSERAASRRCLRKR
jgi:RNA polymerase sigma-70 factor (ECF subfamily)